MSYRYLIAVILFALTLSACGGGGSAPGAPAVSPGAQPARPQIGNNLPGPRPVAEPQSFVSFESGHVRPMALSADAQFLFAVNTPDNRLEIFETTGGLSHFGSVTVGMEPVAVGVAPDGTIWVVNHLSDSVSVVDVSSAIPQVVQTLWVGDEPRDIVFAGQNRERAFITTAHRGQNSPVDPQMNTGSVGRADATGRGLDIHRVKTDIGSIIENTMVHLGEAIERRVVCDLGALSDVWLDPEQVGKVITNLVLNACDATPADGEIRIGARAVKGALIVSVADSGCGMSRTYIEQSLFRPFRSTKKDGMGIGLFQSRMIVEAHGGTMEVESEEGHGTTFRVRLPLRSVDRGTD